jgi:hypothetical protein
MAAEPLTKRQRIIRRKGELFAELNSWLPDYKDLEAFLAPYRGRFDGGSDTNKGTRRDQEIINCEPGLDVDVQAAGMQAGLTNPSQQWVQVTTPYAELNELQSVKEWTNEVTRLLLETYERSNIYESLHQFYADISPFGTSVMHIDEDPDTVIRSYVYPCGTYALANNSKLRVDTCYRELKLTVAQLVDEFGFKKTPDGPGVSAQVKAMYDQRNYDAWIPLLHAMQPNDAVEYGRGGPRGMAFASCWLELGAGDDAGFLRESGFYEQPFVAGRWATTGVDVYGRGPGHRALGDIKALQLLERRKLQGVDKIIDPPMVLPEQYRDLQVSLRPGSQIYSDGLRPNEGARPALVINQGAIQVIDEVIAQHLRRIAKALHADLWMFLSQIEAGKMTATEAQLRKNETMLQLGPMLTRFFSEVLRPMNRRTFAIMMRRGRLPEPPRELLGVELRDEYISILAQAQRATRIQSLREFAGFAIEVARAQAQMQMPPTALDKLDIDQALDEYREMTGAPPSIIRSDDQVDRLRAARAQQQAQAQRAAAVQQAAGTAKDIAAADTEGDNALTRIMDAMGMGKPAA